MLRPYVDSIRAAGADLVCVGNGAPHFARAFREDLGLDVAGVPVLTDEARLSYALLGFRRGVGAILSPRVALHALRASRAGHRQTGTQGDALQLGGVVVVRPGGEIAFRHASREPGDHPDPSEILDAVRRTRH